jgi:hypothetical protein
MNRRLLLLPLLALAFSGIDAVGNPPDDAPTIASIQLAESEYPEGYAISKEDHIKSIQATIFYDRPDLYARIIGTVEEKAAQSLEGPEGDNGTILYFRFKEPVKNLGFIQSLIWGEKASTDEHPERIISKGNWLVIVSFDKGSEAGDRIAKSIEGKL